MNTADLDQTIRKIREKRLGTEVLRKSWELRNQSKAPFQESRFLPSAADLRLQSQNALLRIEIRTLKAELAPAPAPLTPEETLLARLASLEARLEDKLRKAEAPKHAENPAGRRNTHDLVERQRKAAVERMRASLAQ